MRTLTAAFLFCAVCLSSLFVPAVVAQDKSAGPSRRNVPVQKPKPVKTNVTETNVVTDASPESSQSDIAGPASSDEFGTAVAVLPNGNIVVTDPFFDGVVTNGGAVYLYNGSTLALISTLTGNNLNDQVGSGGVTVLSNGNFVVRSPNWGATDLGAVTFGGATTGVSGNVSAANSLVGSTAGDLVGSGGLTALPVNGNYVVSSPNWDNGANVDAGAATLGNGTTGSTGTVAAGISVTGSSANDLVSSGGVTALTNGNYVVKSPNWNAADLGAATFGNGTTGVTGPVGAGNSLIGSTLNDFVTSGGVTALTNGNYVVSSPVWNSAVTDVGAATWGNGATGTAGSVTAANSIIGAVLADTVGAAGVTALSNGNYVVRSPSWDNGGATNAGAATWGNGATGTVNIIVSSANSLVGSTTNDGVSGAGVTALTNGNYVVRSPNWNNGATVDAGAATFGNGGSGVTGAVSAGNSLVGTTLNDLVGLGSVAALSNGNYAVGSPNWGANDIGAVTWGNGTTGTFGDVTAGISLTGVTANDNVGGVTALTNGNYVVNSPNWGATNVGAVTWVLGTGPTSTTVTLGNSLTGTTANDNIGGGGVTALTNGNYVVRSQFWDGTAVNTGAVTRGNGTTGMTGTVSDTNSLVGSTLNDQVGGGGVIALTNGNYTVRSPNWDNGATVNAGAVTYGSGSGGATTGPVSNVHSVLGTVAGGVVAPAIPPTTPISLDRLVVGRPSSNLVTILTPDPPSDPRTNYALASNGGVASASSELSAAYPATATNNGDRKGLNWDAGGGWHDATQNTFPDWVQIDFSGTKTIDEIDVFTLQDNLSNPSEPDLNMTFSLYGVTHFDVQYWNGSGWVTVPGGSITGNNKIWTKVTFPAVSTTKVRVLVNNAVDGQWGRWSRLVEIEAWGTEGGPTPTPTPTPTPDPRTNYALASNGGVASASSELSAAYPATATNNGDRKGLNWDAGGGWHDATQNTFPDWVQIDFSGTKTIDEIDVFTLQDNLSNPSEPDLNMTFSLYGVTHFDVQYWNGSGWVTVPGGSITGNNKIWTKVTFPAVSTTKVRVLVNNAVDGQWGRWSRLVEIEAWGTEGGPTPTPTPTPTPDPRTNYALASNGGVASASSELSAAYPATATNNGDRKGLNWDAGGGWHDATQNTFPDWVQIDFSGTKTIDEIDVFTLQDNLSNPSEPDLNMTFSLYGVTHFDVQYWNGSGWVTVPGGSITGNNKIWTKVTFPAVSTTKVRVLVNNAVDGQWGRWSRLVEIEAWGTEGGPTPTPTPTPTPDPRTNYALASNGGVASASSELSAAYPATATNNGDRKGLNWDAGGGWHDATQNTFPDWVQIDFSGTKTIDEIDVFTLQDNLSNPSEPDLNMTFSLYGVTHFDVQYWNGSGWVTVPGGSITGNNKIWTKVTFPAVSTTKVRVLVNNAVDGQWGRWSRLVEIEAWGPT